MLFFPRWYMQINQNRWKFDQSSFLMAWYIFSCIFWKSIEQHSISVSSLPSLYMTCNECIFYSSHELNAQVAFSDHLLYGASLSVWSFIRKLSAFFTSSSKPLGPIQPNLTQNFLSLRGIQVYLNKGTRPFNGEII